MKDGTENSQGKAQVISNITACQSIAEAVRTTLGPRGMDKMIVDAKGDVTISNDGATILKKLDIVHPGAKTLVDIARSQDDEVSFLAGQLMKKIITNFKLLYRLATALPVSRSLPLNSSSK